MEQGRPLQVDVPRALVNEWPFSIDACRVYLGRRVGIDRARNECLVDQRGLGCLQQRVGFRLGFLFS